MTTHTRPAMPALLLALSLLAGTGALSGCAAQEAPAAPMPTATPTPTPDWAAAEKVIRAAEADLQKNGQYTDTTLVGPGALAEAQAFRDELKAQGLTEKGTTKLESVEPIPGGFHPETRRLALYTCSTVTGGFYDSKGRSVTVDAAGKPVDDKKPRRVKEQIRLVPNPQTGQLYILSFETLADPC